jgi:subtilase family serine protease
MLIRRFSICLLLCFCAAQLPAQRNRIVGPVDNNRRIALQGHINPRIRSGSDQGRVDASFKLPYVTLVLQPSAGQAADLEKLLAQQQDPSSPNYHRWLTPEQYADRFGASQEDVNKIAQWLTQQGLTVAQVARGRNWVASSGDARTVERAFGTEIHHYTVDGKTHFANATEPAIPAAFQGVVAAIHGLDDFRLHRPKYRILSTPASATGNPTKANYTSSLGNHYIAPDDFSVIYNVKSLYGAGIDGSGQTIAVAGQTAINLSDIQQFRSYFNLPANDPQTILVPQSRDPGISRYDLPEADLDLEIAGSVARNAKVIYVYAYDVMNAVQYAIDQNLAPVLTVSYGSCESDTSSAGALAMRSWAQQGNAQGITWFAASGDAGAADCSGGFSRTASGASVDLPAGIPEVTGVGGTRFDDGTGTYWRDSGDANHASALSYIPEVAWNDSAQDGSPSASGGGASAMFSKPSWQTGMGVPEDGARDVPDVSVAGSADHDGFLTISNGKMQVVGGTSVGAPAFAGLATLLNHYLVSKRMQSSPGLGNMNVRLYSLAQAVPGAFHDVTTGDNIVTGCPGRFPNCAATAVGFNAGPGYDLVTGLGTVDAYSMVTSWFDGGATQRADTTMAVTSDASGTVLTATVQSSNGGTPTGTVAFYAGGALLGTATLAGSGGTAAATLTITADQLPQGAATISAQYNGDDSNAAATASLSMAVPADAGPA